MEPSSNPVPKHIGIILDGNRRFAKKLMMKPWMGHEWGAKKIEKMLDWCKELDIHELTLYAFSVQNFNRPKDEFNFLMDIFRREFDRLTSDKRLEEHGIQIVFIGRIAMFPNDIQLKMHRLMERTKNYRNYIINFAMAYGGREEVIDATRKVAQAIKDGKLSVDQINEETFGKNLYMNDEPDLIIRTGGEKRTSNFLIWQSHYSEWFFLEKPWPEFEKQDLVDAIAEYKTRERRFGK